MSDKRDEPDQAPDPVPELPGTNSAALDLATETGITEAQAEELIRMLGPNRASLLREARILKKDS